MRRKILWVEKYFDKGNIVRKKILRERKKVLRERKYYEEICDKNGLPE